MVSINRWLAQTGDGSNRDFRALRLVGCLLRPTRDRWHEQHLIAIPERVRSAAEEADVFLIHINIQEAARLSGFITQMRS